jgi:hypothetical protein
VKHLSSVPLYGRLLDLTHRYKTRLERLAKDKYYITEEKRFVTLGLGIKLTKLPSSLLLIGWSVCLYQAFKSKSF